MFPRDPRIAELNLNGRHWRLLRLYYMPRYNWYASLRLSGQQWLSNENGQIVMTVGAKLESPIMARLAHYHMVRIAVNEMRADALAQLTPLGGVAIDLDSI